MITHRVKPLFVFVLGLFVIACSEENVQSGQAIIVDISPKITVYYADTDLSSDYPFPRFTFFKPNILLANNIFRNSLDTLFFDGDTLRVKEGFYYRKDGPRKIENYTNLIYTFQGLIYFHAKSIMIDNDGVSDIENHLTVNSDVFGKDVFYGLAGGVSFYLDEIYRGYDEKRGRLYFFANNFQNGEFKMVAFDLDKREFLELPMWANVDLVKAHEVKYKSFSKNSMPFIFIHEDRLVVSYNYSSEFSIVDLVFENTIDKNYSSNLFPSEKKLPISIDPGFDIKDSSHMKHVLTLLDDWDYDVAFGNFERLPNGKGFCRIVKSPHKKSKDSINLTFEIFDNDFIKIGEVDLSEMEPDLSTFYFANQNKLFFKAKNQKLENYLDYYLVEVDF